MTKKTRIASHVRSKPSGGLVKVRGHSRATKPKAMSSKLPAKPKGKGNTPYVPRHP